MHCVGRYLFTDLPIFDVRPSGDAHSHLGTGTAARLYACACEPPYGPVCIVCAVGIEALCCAAWRGANAGIIVGEAIELEAQLTMWAPQATPHPSQSLASAIRPAVSGILCLVAAVPPAGRALKVLPGCKLQAACLDAAMPDAPRHSSPDALLETGNGSDTVGQRGGRMDVHFHVTSTHQPQPAAPPGPARSEQPHHTDAHAILSKKRQLNRRSQARYRQNLVVRAPFIEIHVRSGDTYAHAPLCRDVASRPRVSIGTWPVRPRVASKHAFPALICQQGSICIVTSIIWYHVAGGDRTGVKLDAEAGMHYRQLVRYTGALAVADHRLTCAAA